MTLKSCEVWSKGHQSAMPEPVPENIIHQCGDCSLGFGSANLLSIHGFRIHGVKCPVSQKLVSSWCPVYLMNFSSRHELIAHCTSQGSRKVGRCTPILMEFFQDENFEEVESLEKQAAKEKVELKPCVVQFVLPASS